MKKTKHMGNCNDNCAGVIHESRGAVDGCYFCDCPCHRSRARLLCLVSFLGLLCICSYANAQSVVVNTGLSNQVYPPGDYVSSVPAIIPPGGINKRSVTLDVANHTDPSVCVKFGLEQSLDGVNWENGGNNGPNGVCGRPGGFKDIFGNPVSVNNLIINSSTPLPDGSQLRTTATVIGGSLQTNSAIRMWGVQ